MATDCTIPASMAGTLKAHVGDKIVKTITTFDENQNEEIYFASNSCGAGIIDLTTTHGTDGEKSIAVTITVATTGAFNLAYKEDPSCPFAAASASCTIH